VLACGVNRIEMFWGFARNIVLVIKLILRDMPAISSTIPARAAGRAAIPGGHTPYGMESFRGAGSCHAQLHAMPRLGIAAREKGSAGSLQLRAARNFQDLL